MTDKQQTLTKKERAQLMDQWSTADDLFVKTTYRKLKNKQKKLQKIEELEKKVRKGETKPDEQQKQMLDSKASLVEEMKDIESYILLYVKSNPSWEQSKN